VENKEIDIYSRNGMDSFKGNIEMRENEKKKGIESTLMIPTLNNKLLMTYIKRIMTQ